MRPRKRFERVVIDGVDAWAARDLLLVARDAWGLEPARAALNPLHRSEARSLERPTEDRRPLAAQQSSRWCFSAFL